MFDLQPEINSNLRNIINLLHERMENSILEYSIDNGKIWGFRKSDIHEYTDKIVELFSNFLGSLVNEKQDNLKDQIIKFQIPYDTLKTIWPKIKDIHLYPLMDFVNQTINNHINACLMCPQACLQNLNKKEMQHSCVNSADNLKINSENGYFNSQEQNFELDASSFIDLVSAVFGNVDESLKSPFNTKQPPLQVYQLKIQLKGIRPPIWRRIHILNTATFADLHDAIQDVFNWVDYHLHEFSISTGMGSRDFIVLKGRTPGCPSPEYLPDQYGDLLEHEFQLWEFLDLSHKTLSYLYDFGDNWDHKITLEKVLEINPENKYPKLIKSMRKAPREDSRGEWI